MTRSYPRRICRAGRDSGSWFVARGSWFVVRRGGRPTWAPLLVVRGSWLVHLRTPQSAFGGQLPFAGEPFRPQELNDAVKSAPNLPGRERQWLVVRG